MVLTHPDFALASTPPTKEITPALWWLWLRLKEMEPSSELGGILAWKRGFHSTGKFNSDNYPGDYSIREAPNRTGPWWWTHCAALDWTFPEAQARSYGRMNLYSGRLDRSARDNSDPRVDMVLFEWFGQTDSDSTVEGYNEYREGAVTSDPSHLWHIHLSFLRNKVGDFWGMWALLTVLMGWSVAQWRESVAPQQEQPGLKEDEDVKFVFGNGKWTLISSTGATSTVDTQAKGSALAKVWGNAVVLTAAEYAAVMDAVDALSPDA